MYLRAWDLYCLTVLVTFISTSLASQKLLNNFRASTEINNVLINKDKTFIAAINGLYLLDSNNFTLLAEHSTGPVLDSSLCSTDLTSCVGSRDSIRNVDNYNKILQYSPKSDLLLLCGSVHQGVCEWRDPKTLRLSTSTEQSVIPVASNAHNASTVSLVFKDTIMDEDQLYVAATLTADSPYRDPFPAVATRSLPSLATLNSGSLEGEAAVFIRADYRPRFRVNYVTAFTSDYYIYSVAVQNRDLKFSSLGQSPVSRLIRVCQNDDKYVSYSEIEIQCRGDDNTNFNIVKDMKLIGEELVGVFTDSSSQKSAVCFFQMQKIRLTFWYNIDRCWSGTSTVGLPHIGRDSKCSNKTHIQLPEETCLLGVGGSIEVSQIAAKQFEDRQLTKIDGRLVQDRFLLALGTNSGDILQFEVKGDKHNRRLVKSYSEFLVGPDPVSRLEFLDDERFLAVSGNEISTFKTSVCPESADCQKCLAARDPLCGFCVTEGKCSSQVECSSSLINKCPRINGLVSPLNVSVSASSHNYVTVPMEHLPLLPPKMTYKCFFGPFQSNARITEGGLDCPLPTETPVLKNNQDHVSVTLVVRASSSLYNIVEQNITYYDCRSQLVCSKCSSTFWPCEWCASERACLSVNEKCDIKSNGKCPHIDMSLTQSLIIADSTNKSIEFPVKNMLPQSSSKNLKCLITSVGNDFKSQAVAAKFVGKERVQCDSTKYSFETDKAEQNFTLELRQDQELIDKVPLTVYKCSVMASDCSSCLALDPKYGCTWCADGCHYGDHCPVRPTKARADMLCNTPVILNFEPSSGPIEGGTRITIVGKDLGSRIQDVQGRVIVGSSKCKVVDYEVSVKIVCVVEEGVGSGPVRITIGRTGKRQVESAEHFHFLEPTIRSIQPNFGPLSGGTKLDVHGENLDVGANVSVYLDNLLCKLEEKSRSRNMLTCVTSASDKAYSVSSVKLQVDGTTRILNTKFEYRADPSITHIDPLVAYESGGRILNVKGDNFDSVREAKMYLSSNTESEPHLVSEAGLCQIQNSTDMSCESPKLLKGLLMPDDVVKSHHSFNRFSVGFFMDGVASVQNLGRQFLLMTVVDPQFAAFRGFKALSLGQPLVIEGKHLTLAGKPEEYTVTIGTEKCEVILLKADQIVCRTPEVLPPSTDDLGNPLKDGRSLVVVRFGSGRIRAEIGPLEFTDAVSLQSSAFIRNNLVRIIFIFICGVAIVGVGLVLMFILWRRRSNEHEQDYKRIQMQMEQLESNVRNECKQAFAELQTDMMIDLNMTMDSEGVPFHDRLEFFSRLLFKDGMDTSVLGGYGTAGIYATHNPSALIQFQSLLYNRQFVFVLVQMVEANPSISISERSTLASLLMVPLSADMAYCTDIVFTLLAAHIQTSCQNKTSHLLFRKSDSLVEKLFQHWLSFTLFPAMVEPMGPARQLYLLYRALKFQAEKGPIDACTNQARYSLSEQRLLRESVDAQQLLLMVIPLEGFGQAPVPLRVLDCDTISQVKSKLLDALYKNEPFSRRLTTDQFDLEWRCPRKGNMILMDDDQPHIKTVKKLNTIRYYHLQSNSVLTMQQRSHHSFTTFRSESGGSSDTTCSMWSSTQLIDQNGLPISPSSNCYSVHYYHLSPPISTKTSTLQSHANAFLTFDKKNRKQHTLQRHSSQQQLFLEASSPRNIPEVFLTRLVMCKGTVQQFIDEFLNSVMYNNVDVSEVPVVLKYVLDFLDQQALRNQVTDPEVVHAWKTNAYLLRFWVQLLHNSDSLFDIPKQQYVDSSLVVIGQTLIDAFSRNELPLCKESPSSKLLFAKDIGRFRPVSSRMFSRIRQQPRIDDDKFFEYVKTLASDGVGMSVNMAMNELLNWSKANILRLSDLLEQDPMSVKQRLGERLQETARCSLVPSEPTDHIYATLQ